MRVSPAASFQDRPRSPNRGPASLHPYNGHDDDEGIGERAGLFEQFEYPDEMAVEVFDLKGVVEQVVPDDLAVRPKTRDAVHVGQLLAAISATERLRLHDPAGLGIPGRSLAAPSERVPG